jgi:hypothetical protein
MRSDAGLALLGTDALITSRAFRNQHSRALGKGLIRIVGSLAAWLLRGVFVFGRILGAATATANFFFFAGFKVADEHVELDNALLFRIFVGFRLLRHNCASCESDDDDRVLVCRVKTTLVRVDVATIGWSRRVSETSLDSH